jgi:membrane-associated protein
MVTWLQTFIIEHPACAHWVLFSALMLAGLNFPISEDLVMIIGGVLASTVIPANTAKLFLAVFAGAYVSDWMVYWLGRGLGPRLWNIGWFRRVVKQERLIKIECYYARYGVITLLVGRFIPFGVRNCLFMAAGMARMPFTKFLIADGIACLSSNSTLFWLSYAFGRNWEAVANYVEAVDLVIFGAFVVAVFSLIWYKKLKKKRVSESDIS